MAQRPFDLLLAPSSVVVVGVSTSPSNLGKEIIRNCLRFGYKGDLFAVGREEGEVFGIKIYRTLSDLPAVPQFAAILVPAPQVPALVEECGRLGIRAVLISSGGFSEYGSEREKLEASLLAAARRYGVRLIGPNCIGVVNMEIGLCTPFAPLGSLKPLKGHVSVISQSGGVGILCMELLSEEYIGFSKMVSVGNKLDLDETDFVEILLADQDTRVICAYLEGITRGRRFFEALARSDKPVVVMKANRSPVSGRIARSHTAALASDDRVIEAALKQAGAIRVGDLREFVPCAKVFELPALRGNHLVVLSMSGGMSVIGADACAELGFELPDLPADLTRALEERGRGGVIRLGNPLDFGDIYDPSVFVFALEEILKLPYIDGAVLSLPRLDGLASIQGGSASLLGGFVPYLKDLMERYKKPVAASFFSRRRAVEPIAERREIPLFCDIREAIWALSRSRIFWQKRLAAEAGPVVLVGERESRRSGDLRARQLAVHDALSLVAEAGIEVVKSVSVTSEGDLDRALQCVGFPLVMKVAAEGIAHKSDVGGVKLGIGSPEEAREAFRELSDICRARGAPPCAVVQALAEPGLEVVVGAKRDTSFGPVVLFGLGGIWVEVLDDVALRLAPIEEGEAAEMVKEIRGAAILRGWRGAPAADASALCRAIACISRLIAERAELEEIEINPLIASPGGVTAVDARATVLCG